MLSDVGALTSARFRQSNKQGRVVADNEIRSSLLPGGDFTSAVLNRQLMAYADRGGASGIIGDRWADHCGDVVEGWAGGVSDVPGGRPPIQIDRVARLDAYPRIAHLASKRSLQNPDFIVIGTQEGHPAIQAADAKFSIETARSRQVSVEVLSALLALRVEMEPATGVIDPEARIEPGFFMSPDYPLTQLMMRRRYGIMRVSVHDDEVEILKVDPAAFFAGAEGVEVMRVLAGVDALPVSIDDSLLAGLYYFRVARAAIGSWVDSVRPLLQMNDRVEIDIPAIVAEATLFVETRAALSPPPAGASELAGLADSAVHAELGELVSGARTGRTTPVETTLYKSVGVAVQDLAAAALVLAAAQDRGTGLTIELEEIHA